MTLVSFLGYIFLAYGPASGIISLTVARKAPWVILFIFSAFIWLISILLISVIWFVAKPLRETFYFSIPVSVGLQEVFRWLLFIFYGYIEAVLNRLLGITDPFHGLLINGLVCGLGFGMMNALISYIDVLADTLGPGVVYCPACPDLPLFFVLALMTTAMTFLNMTWTSMIFYASRHRSILLILWVWISHLGISFLTSLFENEKIRYGCIFPLGVAHGLIAVNALILMRLLRP